MGRVAALCDTSGEADVDDSEVVELGRAIEAEMFGHFEGATADYKAKFRQLFNNLKNPKNPELRFAVLRGRISPSRLCSMTSQVRKSCYSFPLPLSSRCVTWNSRPHCVAHSCYRSWQVRSSRKSEKHWNRRA